MLFEIDKGKGMSIHELIIQAQKITIEPVNKDLIKEIIKTIEEFRSRCLQWLHLPSALESIRAKTEEMGWQ